MCPGVNLMERMNLHEYMTTSWISFNASSNIAIAMQRPNPPAEHVSSVPTVYWPTPCQGDNLDVGYVIGWASGDISFVVSCIVPVSALDEVLTTLGDLYRAPSFQPFHHYCAGIPCILGIWRQGQHGFDMNDRLLHEVRNRKIDEDVEFIHSLLIATDATKQTTSSRYDNAFRKPTSDVIENENGHHPTLFATADCGRGAISHKLPAVSLVPRARTTLSLTQTAPPMTIVMYEPHKLLDLDVYAAKPCRQPPLYALGATAVVKTPSEPSRSAFDCILSQCNSSQFLAHVISKRLSNSAITETRSPSILARLFRWLLQPLIFILMCFRNVAGVVVAFLEWRFPSGAPLIGGLALYEVSTLARQLHLKLWDFCMWPTTLRRLQDMRRDVETGVAWHSPDALFEESTLWYDIVHRSLLDVLVGVGVCCLFLYTPWAVKLILTGIHTFGELLHIDVLRAWVDWLMGLPAGLKLNHFAGKKIGGAVLSCIDFWEHITTYLTPIEPAIVVVVGFFGFGGFSLLMAAVSDILATATIHLFMLYTQFAWLHSKQVNLLSSLWKLFRGKKQNVLRNRVDSNDYDIAQLLLGTLFFTVVFFLFPTTLVYYVFFLAIWLLILFTKMVIWWTITTMNNFPVYTIYCALMAKFHLPMGVFITSEAVSSQEGSCERWDDTGRIMQRAKFGTPAYLADDKSLAASTPWRQTHWFSMHSLPAGIGIALSPFGDAFSMVLQRYSVGTLIKSFISGAQPLGLFRSVKRGSKAGTASAASSGVSASGLAFAMHNAAANAPVEGPAPVVKIDKQAITERFYSDSSSLPDRSTFYSDMNVIADAVCLGWR